jgi:UDP-N-acetylglucosamine 3-dehydrogenase
MTLKVGIIGCGSIANKRHMPEYAAHQDVEIVAVCDVVKERSEAANSVFGGKIFTDFNELLAYEEVEAVSVCTPNYLHAPISVAALKAGKHVLCEKPMATSLQEAEEMIAAAENSGKTLMIAHNQRFVPAHQKAREIIANGELGKIYSFRTAFGHPGPDTWSVDGLNSWFFKKEEAFIGAMGDLGVHKTDLIRYLLGEEISEVGAFVETSAKEFATVDDTAVCILKTENGIIGTLAASWSYTAKEDNSTIIYGEKGILRLEDDPEYSLIAQYKDGSVVRYELGKIQTNESGGQKNTHVIEHFVEAVRTGKAPLITGEEGKRSLSVILAALASSEKKTIEKVKTGVHA